MLNLSLIQVTIILNENQFFWLIYCVEHEQENITVTLSQSFVVVVSRQMSQHTATSILLTQPISSPHSIKLQKRLVMLTVPAMWAGLVFPSTTDSKELQSFAFRNTF